VINGIIASFFVLEQKELQDFLIPEEEARKEEESNLYRLFLIIVVSVTILVICLY